MKTKRERDFSTKQRKKLAKTGAAMPQGGFPIKSKQDVANAVRAIGRAKNPAAAKRHIKQRAKSVGATGLLPDSWKKSESFREALRMLRARCVDGDLSDALFGVTKLLEAAQDKPEELPNGRAGTLLDLRQKMELAEDTHDAENIQTLLTALQTFLDEELHEEPSHDDDEEEDGMGKRRDEMEVRRRAAEADGFAKYDDAAEEMEERRKAAEADQFQRYGKPVPGHDDGDADADGDVDADGDAGMKAAADTADDADDDEDEEEEGVGIDALAGLDDEDDDEEEEGVRSYKCAACGYEETGKREGKRKEEGKKDEAKKESRHSATNLRESRTVAVLQRKLREAERETIQLRAEKRQRQLKERAVKAIRTAGCEGIVKVKELLALHESAWPAILRVAAGQGPRPHHGIGGGSAYTPQPRPSQPQPASAAEFFNAQFGQ